MLACTEHESNARSAWSARVEEDGATVLGVSDGDCSRLANHRETDSSVRSLVEPIHWKLESCALQTLVARCVLEMSFGLESAPVKLSGSMLLRIVLA